MGRSPTGPMALTSFILNVKVNSLLRAFLVSCTGLERKGWLVRGGNTASDEPGDSDSIKRGVLVTRSTDEDLRIEKADLAGKGWHEEGAHLWGGRHVRRPLICAGSEAV